MPTIEVLPTTSHPSAPGWTLVPDNGYDPSKAALVPSQPGKRAARTAGLTSSSTTTAARQQAAILKHIQDLDRESPRDVQIALPKGAGGKKKETVNVRRIVNSNKTFANHLADEEAMLALEGGQQRERRDTVPTAGKRKSTTATEDMGEGDKEDVTMGNTSAQPDPESDHLLRTYIPAAPTEAEMEALIMAPPLSYNQARAAPSVGKPQRFFCEICGYWGSIRCMKCGARVCGLECKGAHEEGRCLRY